MIRLGATARMLEVMALAAGMVGCAPESDFVLEEELPDATGCGDAFCESGLRIALVAPVFAPGAYTLALRADGVESDCSFVIGGLEDGCGPDGPCLLDDDCGVTPSLSFPPHSVVVQVGPGAPEVVDITVYRGGSQIAATTLVPAYQDYEPAGPGCEPACEIASAQLDIP